MSHITILHSNDMHGDWMPQETDGKMTGGLPRLSGYIKSVRNSNPNTYKELEYIHYFFLLKYDGK